nr:DUF1269 domain-containing protein [Cereibacter sphaeroides]
MEDVVVVTRDAEGKVKLHQAVNLTAAGAVGGSFWGLLIGLLFLNPLLGLAVGAGAGSSASAPRTSRPACRSRRGRSRWPRPAAGNASCASRNSGS